MEDWARSRDRGWDIGQGFHDRFQRQKAGGDNVTMHRVRQREQGDYKEVGTEDFGWGLEGGYRLGKKDRFYQRMKGIHNKKRVVVGGEVRVGNLRMGCERMEGQKQRKMRGAEYVAVDQTERIENYGSGSGSKNYHNPPLLLLLVASSSSSSLCKIVEISRVRLANRRLLSAKLWKFQGLASLIDSVASGLLSNLLHVLPLV
ncbi:hypothetical protein AMTR_s00084p00172920 [Amborella trichopoda]|uniref:Uncharacterized protein n=1 Tax=Amborella trichopoda TaxID=13333 RepID=W1P330_AMBTC|nr:hypothetical protein AMTR_s00084p00172920 [Amborella trichopoda]